MRTHIVSFVLVGALLLPTLAPAQVSPVGSSAMSAPAQASERKLQLTFNADGTVNLVAQNVPVREILAEWRRKCGCTVVNAERVNSAVTALPVMFDRAAQSVVLDSLLRQAAGYTLTPRRAGSTSPSNFETIYILASSAPTASGYSSPYVPNTPPAPTQGNPDDELAPARNFGQMPMQNGVPQPQSAPQNQSQPPAGNANPTMTTPSGSRSPFVPIVPIGGAGTPATPPATGRGGGGPGGR